MMKAITCNRKIYEAFAAAMEIMILLGACMLLLRAAVSIV